jgi:hypothetical protein
VFANIVNVRFSNLIVRLQFMYLVNFNNISATGAVDLPSSARMMLENLDQALADGGIHSLKSADGHLNSSQLV